MFPFHQSGLRCVILIPLCFLNSLFTPNAIIVFFFIIYFSFIATIAVLHPKANPYTFQAWTILIALLLVFLPASTYSSSSSLSIPAYCTQVMYLSTLFLFHEMYFLAFVLLVISYSSFRSSLHLGRLQTSLGRSDHYILYSILLLTLQSCGCRGKVYTHILNYVYTIILCFIPLKPRWYFSCGVIFIFYFLHLPVSPLRTRATYLQFGIPRSWYMQLCIYMIKG